MGWSIAILFLLSLAALPVRAEEGILVTSSRVDDKGQVEVARIPSFWNWKKGEDIPCLEPASKKKEIRKLKPCLSEVSTVLAVQGKDRETGESRLIARYIFDLPFEYPVVVAAPACSEAGIEVESASLIRGFGIVGIRCGDQGSECAEVGGGRSVCWNVGTGKIAASHGLKVIKDTEGGIGRDPRYLILNRSGAVAGRLSLKIPLPPPSPTPSPSPSPTPMPTPVPTPTPKPKVRRNWVFGGYLGASAASHKNEAADGSGQSQTWTGKQLHMYFNANRFSPIQYGLIPEIEMRMSQLGGLSGVTIAGAYLHKNLLRSKSLALLAGLGGEIMGMNGTDKYGIISSLGWATHVVLRPFDRSFFVAWTYGPLLTAVPSLTSYWTGVIADIRLRLFGFPFHIAADAALIKVPASVSAVNATYSSTQYGLMVGYYFGE